MIDLPYSADKIIETLEPQVTPERLERMNQVIAQRTPQMSLVLEDIYDRGNASAVMRSAEAFGFFDFHTIELQEKFKESKRVTQGAHKWLLNKKWSTTADCVRHLKEQGRKVYVTHLTEVATPIQELDTSTPFALCFGNEKQGASQELVKLSDGCVFIPMRGFVQSFNISVAAALCFYELHQKLSDYRLNDEEKKTLKAHYLMKSVERWPSFFE